MGYLDQYAAMVALMQQWNIRRLVIDRTGLGEGLAALLTQRFGEERIVAFRFTRPSKSHLTYQLLSMINTGRLKMDQVDEAPPMIVFGSMISTKPGKVSHPRAGDDGF